MKKIELIKDKKELFEFLKLPEDYFQENIPESILGQINKAKSKERSEIPTYLWTKNKYAETDCLQQLINKYENNKIKTIDYNKMSLEDFRKNIESQKIPCIIQGIGEEWKKKYSFSWKVTQKENDKRLWGKRNENC